MLAWRWVGAVSALEGVLEPTEAVPGGLGNAAFQAPPPHTCSFKPPGQDRASPVMEVSCGVQGDGSITPMGTATQPQPCIHCISRQRVLHEQSPKMSQTTLFCLFPNLSCPEPCSPQAFGGLQGPNHASHSPHSGVAMSLPQATLG